ncbi:MAG TPA: hypothetical protein VMZ28_10960 [Kofleriaceae bacterium]|nr:hypothetical protein [Kofleriaceae bacterium]
MRMLPALVVLTVSSLAGCGKPVPANTRGCYGSGCAIITTSHYNPDFTGNGTLHTVKFPERKVTSAIDASLDPDLDVEIRDDKLYTLNRNSGTVRRYDIVTFAIDFEISTGDPSAPNTLSSPRDMWIDPGSTKIYVSLSGNDGAQAIGILDTRTPNAGVVKFIAIPAIASDTDGKPEASDLYACKGKLYVSTQDYTIMGRDVSYTGAGRIAIIDLKQDAVVGTITLAGKNPGQVKAEGGDCEKAFVATASSLTSIPDDTSGIERLDLAQKKTLGMIVKDTDIAGRPFAIEVASPTLMFAGIYFDPQLGFDGKEYLGSAKVIAINPQTGKLIGDVTGKAGFINFVQISPDRRLFVGVGAFGGMADPGKMAEGLYVGPADGTMLDAASVLSLGQTPSAVAFHQ